MTQFPLRRAPLTALLALTAAVTHGAAPPSVPQTPSGAEVPNATSVDPGEVPPAVLARAREQAAARATADHLAVAPSLARIERVTWPDGSLGCGRPGEMNTQRIVEGYRLSFAAGSRRYVFHASAAGLVIACDRVLQLPSHPAPPKEPLVHPDPRDNPSE